MVKHVFARLSITFHQTPLRCSGTCLDIYQRVQTTYDGNVNTSSIVLFLHKKNITSEATTFCSHNLSEESRR